MSVQTLESMLASVKKGGKVDEAEIPPPLACSGPGAPSRPPVPPRPSALVTADPESTPPQQQVAPEAGVATPSVSPEVEPSSEEKQLSNASLVTVGSQPTSEENTGQAHSPGQSNCLF